MAKLPKLEHPVFDVIVPSSNKKIKIRPMLVKEEKILLMAKTSGEIKDIYNAMRQVVNNCFAAADVDIDKFTIFDLEYVFLRLRAISESNIVKVTYKDPEDGKDYPFEVDLNKLEVKFPEHKTKHIKLDDDRGFEVKYPLTTFYQSPIFLDKNVKLEDMIEELIIHSIQSYFDGDKVYLFSETKRPEIKEFMENLDLKTYESLRDYVANLPRLSYELKYTNSNGKEVVVEMKTLADFFTF
jgi:hypothetical protein